MHSNIIRLLPIGLIVFNILYSENIDKAMDLYMQGEISLLSEDFQSAEKYFNQALVHSPNDPSILLSLLELNLVTRNFKNIRGILEQYKELKKIGTNTALDIIDLYREHNNKEILDIINLLIANDSLSLELKYEKAQILILNEEWEELLTLYSDIYIITEDSDLFNTLLNLGLSIENPNILYNILKYIWSNVQGNLEILELLIQLSYIAEEKNLTEYYLHELINQDPNNEFAIMMLAEIKILNKNFTESISLLNSIKKETGNTLDLYRMLLIAYSNIGDYENEVSLSSDIITEFPFESIGYESLAISYLENGRYIDAIEILNKAVKNFPEEYYFYYYLGLCYRNTDKNLDAINYFLKALKINPQLKNVMHELAKLYNLESDYNRSDSVFTILIRNNINDAMLMNDYAYIIADRQDVSSEKLDFALKLSKDAIDIVPDSAEYLDTIGWIYYKFGKYDMALRYLLKSESLDRRNPIILEHLGDVYYKLNRLDKALDIYNKIINYNPDNIGIVNKIKLLNEE